ncbi:MAG TPA: tetratricopeptide repeat protein [Burkholderiaceae bacterium]|nr:tetratricopeptide repeat protein [Burkholderiaceae bacterium]
MTHFNPRFQNESDFLATFVARKDSLDFLLRQLQHLGAYEAARHVLIVAPRGYGKTTLLRRIAIAIRTDPLLKQRYLPLSFREEQHNVISLDVFWRNCIQSLLETREEELASPAELDALDAAWMRLAPRQQLPRSAQDGEPQWQELQSRCEALGRRPVLLIDNLDTLLAGLESQHQWTLRQTLQKPDGPILLAAASRYPESTQDKEAAFYDFFRIQTLDRLADHEVLACLRTLAQRRGEPGKPVIELLDRDPGRIAALNALAGGNPRTLGVLYTVLESHMSADVLSQLSAMLDTFTGWYQARTEELPMQARAVFDALALNWDPMTAADLSKTTGLETGAVSSQLSRLEKMGYVEAVALSRRGKGRSGYQLLERFFNIWYLMRNGPRRARQSIKFLTAFLQSCFNAYERRALGRRVLSVERADPGYAVALASTMSQGDLRQQLLDRAQELSEQSPACADYQALIRELRLDGRKKVVFDSALHQQAPKAEAKSPGRASRAFAEANRGIELASNGSFAEAMAVFDSVIAEHSHSKSKAESLSAAMAYAGRAHALGLMGQDREQLAAFDEIVARYGHEPEPVLQSMLAVVSIERGNLLGKLGRPDEELAAYDEIIHRHGLASSPTLQAHVTQAMFAKAVALLQQGRTAESIAACDSVLARFSEDAEPSMLPLLARSLLNKGFSLRMLRRFDEAIEAYEQVARRAGQSTDPALQVMVARAACDKCIALRATGRLDEAMAACDSVIERHGQSSAAELQSLAAKALRLKGECLGERGRFDEQIAILNELSSRYRDTREPELRMQFAKALLSKGAALHQLGRIEEEIASYDELIQSYGSEPQPSTQLHSTEWALSVLVARSLLYKGVALNRLGRLEEEVALYEELIARHDVAKSTVPQEHAADNAWPLLAAQAWLFKGITLGQLNTPEEGIAAYDELISRYSASLDPELQAWVFRAMVHKGLTLELIGQSEDALAAYEKAIEQYGQASEPEFREILARALVGKGRAAGRLNLIGPATEALEEVITRHEQDRSPELQALVTSALRESFRLKSDSGDLDAAIAAARRALARQNKQASVWNSLGNVLLDKKGDVDEAERAYREGLLVAETAGDIALLQSNTAYLLALHKGDFEAAQAAVQAAMSLAGDPISEAGRHLLKAIPSTSPGNEAQWTALFAGIGQAADCGDSHLWSDYFDDLQRLLWYVVDRGQGPALRAWMEAADFPLRQAPLYHAVVAAIEGEDHLLKINPEVRKPAQLIHEGVAQLMKLYGRSKGKKGAP